MPSGAPDEGRACPRRRPRALSDGVGSELRCSSGDGHFKAESLDPLLKALRFDCGIVAHQEVLGSGVVVESARCQEVPGDVQNGVSDGDGGLVRSSSPCDASVLRREIRSPGSCRGPCRLDECSLKPCRAVTGSVWAPFAGGLMAGRGDASLRAQMARCWEAAHVDPHLRHQDFSGRSRDATDRRDDRDR